MGNEKAVQDEIALAILALVLSIGLLTPPELSEFYHNVIPEVFASSESVFLIHGRTLLALGGFTVLYLMMLLLTFAGIGILLWKREASRTPARPILFEVLGALVIVLTALQFAALAIGYAQVTHAFDAAAEHADRTEWDWDG